MVTRAIAVACVYRTALVTNIIFTQIQTHVNLSDRLQMEMFGDKIFYVSIIEAI